MWKDNRSARINREQVSLKLYVISHCILMTFYLAKVIVCKWPLLEEFGKSALTNPLTPVTYVTRCSKVCYP